MLPFLYPIISSIIIYHILLLLWSIMAISMSYFHIFPIISIDGNHHWWKPPFLFRISYYIYATISISHNIIYHILLLLWSIMAISMSYFHIFPIISIDGNHHWWKPPFLFHIYVIFISYLYHIYIIFISYYATIFGFSMVHKPSSWGSPIEAAPAHRLSGGLIRQHRTRRAVAAHGAWPTSCPRRPSGGASQKKGEVETVEDVRYLSCI